MLQNPGQMGQVQLEINELAPFLVVVLIRNENPLQPDQQENLLYEWLTTNLEWFHPDKARYLRDTDNYHSALRDSEIVYTFIYYTERKKATWTYQDDIQDQMNQIVIMASWGNFSAIYFSDNELKGRFIDFVLQQDFLGSWPKPIEKNRLNAIFIDGPARTMWLAGIHKRSSLRADSKILMGAKIQDALNPLEDQSYYFTSARCFQRDTEITMGVSPNKSQIWIRKCYNWSDYQNMIGQVLLRLSDNYNQSVENPFPILASPITDVVSVNSAYDLNFLYPEISMEDARDEDQDIIQLLENLSYHTDFDVTGNVASPNLEAQIYYDSQLIGEITVDFHNTLSNRREWDFDFDPNTSRGGLTNIPTPADIRRLIRNGKFLQIRYESGHTFSGGEFYLQRFRDLPFAGWQYENFDGYSVDREKPTSIERIGLDHSLFCWVWNQYTSNCWLYCDDRSGEVADFVKYQQVKPGVPKFSLIHVKGAHGTTNRRFSVSAYEVVTAQAIKNLRHFELENFIEQISRKENEHFLHRIMHDGITPNDITEAGNFKDEFISQITLQGININREVVVLQPHNRQSSIIGRGQNDNARCQLHTLLLSAENACNSLGADFLVITDES